MKKTLFLLLFLQQFSSIAQLKMLDDIWIGSLSFDMNLSHLMEHKNNQKVVKKIEFDSYYQKGIVNFDEYGKILDYNYIEFYQNKNQKYFRRKQTKLFDKYGRLAKEVFTESNGDLSAKEEKITVTYDLIYKELPKKGENTERLVCFKINDEQMLREVTYEEINRKTQIKEFGCMEFNAENSTLSISDSSLVINFLTNRETRENFDTSMLNAWICNTYQYENGKPIVLESFYGRPGEKSIFEKNTFKYKKDNVGYVYQNEKLKTIFEINDYGLLKISLSGKTTIEEDDDDDSTYKYDKYGNWTTFSNNYNRQPTKRKIEYYE